MIRSSSITIPQQQLDDLHARLAITRWPEAETVNDWSQGVPLAYLKNLVNYWQNAYDWRRCEALINQIPQYRLTIDGLDFHFLHQPSPQAGAIPLLLTHGWPGSVLEFTQVIGPLTDPEAHGAKGAQAFHVVCPSLPGYGFSDKPTQHGWKAERIVAAWASLMHSLGYTDYIAQGGDWGAEISRGVAEYDPKHCLGAHINMCVALPTEAQMAEPTERELAALGRAKAHRDMGTGYSEQQRTRPQTLAYGLSDSPVGQAAWILEKFYAWMDCQGDPENVLSKDQLLDNIMWYWLTASAGSSARLYWESFNLQAAASVDVPVAISVFPKDIFVPSKRWAENRFKHIVYFNTLDSGGHFAAMEQPTLFVNELRACASFFLR